MTVNQDGSSIAELTKGRFNKETTTNQPEVPNPALVAKKKAKKKETRTCFECGKVGHTRSHCYQLLNKKRQEREKFPFAQDRQKPTYNLANPRNNSSSCRGSVREKFPTERVNLALVADHQSSVRRKPGEKFRIPFVVDSGATEHIVNDARVLKDCYMVDPVTISTAKDGEVVKGTKRGVINLKSVVKPTGKYRKIEFYDALFVPDLKYNLLSVPKLVSMGCTVHFSRYKAEIFDSSEDLVAVGAKVDGLFILDAVIDAEDDGNAFFSKSNLPLKTWHSRLGHLNFNAIKKLSSKSMVDGLKISPSEKAEKFEVCEPCALGKQTRKSFKTCGIRSSRPLELIHSDVCGPMSESTYDGYQYFVVFVDDFTHFVVVYLIRTKDEVLSKFVDFEAMASAHFNLRISKFRSDNGGEFYGREFQKFCRSKGIQMIPTCPYTPQQNGVSERMNRTLLDKTRAMLHQNNVPKKLWGEAVYVSAYVTNRSPSRILRRRKTSFELWFNKKPDLSNLKVFGCVGYTQIPQQKRKKLDSRSLVLTFVGYANNGYRLWDENTKRIVVSRDVIFDEDKSIHHISQKSVDVVDDHVQYQHHELHSRTGDTESSSEEDESSESDEYDDSVEYQETVGETQTLRRSKRIYEQRQERNKNGNGVYSAVNHSDEIPQTIPQLMLRADWLQWQHAIDEELEAMEENNTWTVVDSIPEGFKAINSMWIFGIKDGTPEGRYKARLVAKGCSQRFGIDYHETFAPVAKMVTIRTILSIAVRMSLHIHQMDVKTAFLNGKLEEEVYMRLPCDEKGISRFCRLNRSIYGLKQASRSWNQRFDEVISTLGFSRLKSDACVYVSKNGKYYVVLYVDDILVIGKNLDEIKRIKSELSKAFRMKDLGEVENFLGLEISRNFEIGELKISQKAYIEKILSRFGMQDCKQIATPMDVNAKWMKSEDPETNKPFKALLGCLQYLALMSRPDISVAVSILSRFQSCATDAHWSGLLRILRYLQGSKDIYLLYIADGGDAVLEGYADADFANHLEDRKSNSGNIFKVFGNIVSWCTKRQPTVSLSSTEAELISLCDASKEGIWLSNFLSEIGLTAIPFTIFEDNIPCIRIAEEPREHQRSKHIDIKYMFVREMIQKKKIKIHYIPSRDQIADLFTKPLPRGLFEDLLLRMKIRN